MNGDHHFQQTVVVVEAHSRAFGSFRREFIRTLLDRQLQVVGVSPASGNSWDPNAPTGMLQRTFRLDRSGVNPLQEARGLLSLRRALKCPPGSLLFAFGVKPILYSALAGLGLGWSRRVAVVTGLGVGFVRTEGGRAKVVRWVQGVAYRALLPRYRTVIFQNSDDLDLFRSLGFMRRHQRSLVVPGSGVNTRSEFLPLAYPSSDVSFLFVGRFLRSKGLVELIEASGVLAQQGFNFSVEVVGWHDPGHPDGITAEELSGLIRNSGAPVTITGPLADVRVALGRNHVFVLPSYREGTSRSTIEAMATARPVITTTAPGCREVIDDGHEGILVQARSAGALAKAMRSYIDNPALISEHGSAARSRAAMRFDSTEVAIAWASAALS